MNPDKTAIEKLWEKHSFDYHEPGVRDPVCVMIKDDFLAALSEAEGERERLQTQIDDIADELGCTEKTSHRHSHGRCIFAAIENLRTEGERWISVEERLPGPVENPEKFGSSYWGLYIVCVLAPNISEGPIVISATWTGKWRNDGGFDLNVTHWQPLPAPPKEKP